ncbi:MAG: mismatch-specific DNA-glycosylase [Solirubrobacterales bacterium]
MPDVLEPGLDIVFCGTAPSAASFAARAYYAKPGNRFWPTLHNIGLTPRQLAPSEYASVTQYGLGLTDVCKTEHGQDADLSADAFDAGELRAKIELHAPRFLAFTSKRSASEALGRKVDYGLQPETFGATRLFVLPSTSGLATRFWDESWWRELAASASRARSLEPRAWGSS